jgi:hypothetical protein
LVQHATSPLPIGFFACQNARTGKLRKAVKRGDLFLIENVLANELRQLAHALAQVGIGFDERAYIKRLGIVGKRSAAVISFFQASRL